MKQESLCERVVGRLEAVVARLGVNRTIAEQQTLDSAKAWNRRYLLKMQADLAALGVEMTISEDTD